MSVFERRDNVITYTVNKAINKDMYITVQNGEVVVNAPWYFTSSKIQQIVQNKKKWILNKIREYENSLSDIQSVNIFGKRYDIHFKYENVKTPELNIDRIITTELKNKILFKTHLPSLSINSRH